MDWVPIAFGTFKAAALLTAMCFAIKWHYDQGQKYGRQAVLRASAKVTGLFVLALLVVGGITLALAEMLGLSLSY
ncbi:hypothetical protein [Thalassospira tepidiphila]|uniref:DUF1146 domain-containing protein n=2 Tax=Thalassospira tepidiphila TaxID=393657 RepID=A0A853KZJ6_9PROT|nr:hypothetical protein [Thalassospira tepidiphila]NJB76577.1 hypothetical protein [Thalassospira tepidiphila]OAZ09905.1 hypothetical protein TH4_12050 [Thalassospira tepidiphila MCCC 1A03514]